MIVAHAESTGLDYFGARYFSAAQGRFSSPDRPLADQHPQDPQSWNLYAFVRNNSLKNRDFDGHVCIWGIGNTCSAQDTSRIVQGASASVGAQATQDAAARVSYLRGLLQLKQTDPSASAARTALEIQARAASSPTGMTIAEIMRPISGEAARAAGTVAKSNTTVNVAMETAGKAGPALMVVGVAASVYNVATSDNTPKALAQESGAWAGAIAMGSLGGQAGAGAGGLIGAFFGGAGAAPGAAIGGFIGAVGGGVYGGIKGSHIGEKLYDYFN